MSFRWAVIGAMITTSIAVSRIIYGSLLDYGECIRHVHYPSIVPSKYVTFGGYTLAMMHSPGCASLAVLDRLPTILPYSSDPKMPCRLHKKVTTQREIQYFMALGRSLCRTDLPLP